MQVLRLVRHGELAQDDKLLVNKTMESFDELLSKAETAHGHLCAGQILGVRMALLGLKRLGIADPHGADRKRLVTYVEIDRCATDAIALVTGCRLGKRALKFRDWGKMAATFVDLATGRGARVVALEDSRELASRLYPYIESKSRQQMLAYRELADEQLFREQWVRVNMEAAELPGSKGERFICPRCGEGVNFGRFVEVGGQRLCLSCARPELRYWEPEDRE
jgi:formylmethanofuran dehydrogenase subunit E